MNSAIRWKLGTAGILAFILFIQVLVFLWGASRGLDFTDEGFYLLSYAHPESILASSTFYYNFGAKIFLILGKNVSLLRIFSLLLGLASALVFVNGFLSFIERFFNKGSLETIDGIWVICLVMLGSMLQFGFGPPTLSYNHMNAALLLIEAGLALMISSKQTNRTVFEVLLGIILALQFFVKPTTAVACFFLMGIFQTLVLYGVHSKSSVAINADVQDFEVSKPGGWVLSGCKTVIFMGLGVMLAFLGYFVFFDGPILWWKKFSLGLLVTQKAGYDVSLLSEYIKELKLLAKDGIYYLLGFFGVLMLLSFAQVGKSHKSVGWGIAVVFISGLLFRVYKNNPAENNWLSGIEITKFVFITVVLWFSILGVHLARKYRSGDFGSLKYGLHSGILTVFLFILPFLGSLGSNNGIITNMVFQLPPWFALIATLLFFSTDGFRVHLPLFLVLSSIGVFGSNQFFRYYLLSPYRLSGSLQSQNCEVKIGESLSPVFVDKESCELITKGRELMKEGGFKNGDPILGFFGIPGLVFALGGSSPGAPWFALSKQKWDLNYENLSQIPLSILRSSFIIEKGEVFEFYPYLTKLGLSFPSNYTLLGEVKISYPQKEKVRFWAPKPQGNV